MSYDQTWDVNIITLLKCYGTLPPSENWSRKVLPYHSHSALVLQNLFLPSKIFNFCFPQGFSWCVGSVGGGNHKNILFKKIQIQSSKNI